MLKRTLIVIAVALGIGCKDKKDQQIWMRSNDYTSWRGEGYSEDTMFYKAQGDNYETIIIPLDKFGNNPTPPCPQITKWTDASKATGRNGFVIKDSLGNIIKDTLPITKENGLSIPKKDTLP